MYDTSKQKQYIKLVEDRKACRLCMGCGLTNPSEIDKGKFDSNQIGPWTRWNGDLNAQIFIVGQEWGSKATFISQKGLDKANADTNQMLVYLLASVGIDVNHAPNSRTNSGVFQTNAALCLKEGKDSSPVKGQWFKNCSKAFLRRQIDLVQPQVVVALGKQAYQGVCNAYGMYPVSKFTEVIGVVLPIKGADGIQLIPVSHCSPMARNLNNQPRSKQFRVWTLIKDALNRPGNCGAPTFKKMEP